MKKIVLLTFSLIFTAVTFAQQVKSVEMLSEFMPSELSNIEPLLSPNTSFVTPSTTPFWSSDFSDPTVWILDNSGQNGGAYGWSIDATVDSWYFNGGINSTSGGSYAEVSNGNATTGTQMLNVVYTMTTAMPIYVFDSIGSANATLSFQEYGARFNDLQEVQISTDGINFTTVGDNLNYPVLSQSGGSAYANPSLREINIAPYIQQNPSTVWVRFSWTTNYPNQATNANVWITYGWFIDDVSIAESPSNLVVASEQVMGGWWIDYLNAGGLGQDYTFYPMSQAAINPYAFESVFTNDGTETQDVTMKVEVTQTSTGSNVFSDVSNTITLAAGEQDTLGAMSMFTPSSMGLYTIDIWGEADSAAAGMVITSTNVSSKETEVTDYTYGKDLDDITGSWRLSRAAGGFEIGSVYDLYANENLYSIDANITDWSVPGANVYAMLYEYDGGSDPIYLDQSDDFTIVNDGWINIPFLNTQSLIAGTTYIIAIGGYQHPTDTAGINLSGTGDYSVDYLLDKDDFYGNGSATWYTISNIPMLRMNFDPATAWAPAAVNDVKTSPFNVYPNPTNGVFSVESDGNVKYDVTVNDVLGKTVYATSTTAISTTIDLSSFEKGIYTIEFKNNLATYTEKIIVE